MKNLKQMHFSKKTIALLAAAATLVSAMPAAPADDTLLFEPGVNTTIHTNKPAQGWATFCTDTKCSEGCGISVSLNNPGCLHEPRARSVRIHDGVFFDRFNLIVSPGDGCRCQTDCIDQIAGDSNECLNLDEHRGGSYRFITSDACDKKDNVC